MWTHVQIADQDTLLRTDTVFQLSKSGRTKIVAAVFAARDCSTVARREYLSHHQDHLNELRRVVGEAAAEPKQRKDTSQSNVGREDLTDWHSCVAAGTVRDIVR